MIRFHQQPTQPYRTLQIGALQCSMLQRESSAPKRGELVRDSGVVVLCGLSKPGSS